MPEAQAALAACASACNIAAHANRAAKLLDYRNGSGIIVEQTSRIPETYNTAVSSGSILLFPVYASGFLTEEIVDILFELLAITVTQGLGQPYVLITVFYWAGFIYYTEQIINAYIIEF